METTTTTYQITRENAPAVLEALLTQLETLGLSFREDQAQHGANHRETSDLYELGRCIECAVAAGFLTTIVALARDPQAPAALDAAERGPSFTWMREAFRKAHTAVAS